MTDWGAGAYEVTAERLEPAAQVAVDALGIASGERVIDVGCGTGNAALLAARLGASVLGVDPAERLLAVARERAAAEGVDAAFAAGEGAAIPAPDGSFDAAVSVFGVIFADADAAAGELLRVVRRGGRIVITTWTDEGPNPRIMALVREAFGNPPQPSRWSDPEVVRGLFAPHAVSVDFGEIAFGAPSAEAYVEEHVAHHPMWLAMRPALEERGKWDDVVAGATEIFADANEDPAAFRTTSRYRVVRVDAG